MDHPQFKPYYLKEEDIPRLSQRAGQLIFNLDTQQILLDTNNARIKFSVGAAQEGGLETWEGSLYSGDGGEIFNDYTNNIALGTRSHAEGGATKAYGTNAHAEGYNTFAMGAQAHTEGSGTIAKNPQSHAEGLNTKAYGTSAHAEGSTTIANNTATHAEGQGTIAQGYASHAEGEKTYATGRSAHAEGLGDVIPTYDANGHITSVEGLGVAEGDYSHVGGQMSRAQGTSAFAHGNYLQTSHDCEVAFGEYNITGTYDANDADKYVIFSYGNGNDSERSNLFWINNEGVIFAKDFLDLEGKDVAISPKITVETIGTLDDRFLNNRSGYSIELEDKRGISTCQIYNGYVDINQDCVILYATFKADQWSNTAPYIQQVQVDNILDEHCPLVDIAYSEDGLLWQDEELAYACLTRVVTSNGYITGYCLNVCPNTDFTIKLKIAGEINANSGYVTQAQFATLQAKCNELEETISELQTLLGNANTLLQNRLNGEE